MPNISFWMIFMVFGIVSGWAKKALEDGKITLTEAAELAEELGELLGIPTELQIPVPEPLRAEPAPGEETESATPETVEKKPTEHTTGHKPVV